MVETSHLWEFNNLSHPQRLNGPRLRGVFAQRQVSPAAVIQLINTTPIAVVLRGRFITPGTRWYGRAVWIYEIRMGRAQAAARCGLEPTQCAKSLEVPLWMLEAVSCSTMCRAEDPRVDCTALQKLKTLLHDSVLQDRHPLAGGADADPHETTPTGTTKTVSSSIRGDPLAQATARNSTEGSHPVGGAASPILGNPASSRGGEGGQP
jgi:hypothetical protein